MKKQVFLTEEGLEKLKIELDTLITIKRPEVIQALKEARSLGDLSENAEYDAARHEQAITEDRIKQLESMINNVTIIDDEEDNDKVRLGSTVKIKYCDTLEIEEYKIVGSQESDPFNNKISNESPIAEAILKKRVNDKVIVKSPNGEYEIEVIEIN